MDYKAWMKKVDALVSNRIGLSVYDLADMNYHDMFEDGYTPEEMVEEVLEEVAYEYGMNF